jgi:hypothetical protein
VDNSEFLVAGVKSNVWTRGASGSQPKQLLSRLDSLLDELIDLELAGCTDDELLALMTGRRRGCAASPSWTTR